jgi:hypothetical protein
MRKLLTGDHTSISRGGVARHALSATTLLLVGFLVVALTQLGGGPSASTVNRGLITPTCGPTSVTYVGYRLGASHPKTVTKTAWKTKTVYKTKTVTVTRTRTKTVCNTVTETTTEPGTTTTTTVTVTTGTESGVTPTNEP